MKLQALKPRADIHLSIPLDFFGIQIFYGVHRFTVERMGDEKPGVFENFFSKKCPDVTLLTMFHHFFLYNLVK